MARVEIDLFSVSFDDDALIFAFMTREDIRVEGQVVQQRQVRMALSHPDYHDDADQLRRLAISVLRNALEDFDSSPVHTPAEDDEDDERGMGE